MVTRTVDFRSDTVTKPTEAMRAAMASAEVDDDVLASDPTASLLEKEMAKTMGKEAALFVPSGTMRNLVSVLVHCDIRGSEVILGDNSHIHIYENGGIATLGGVHPRTVKNNEDGTMDINLIEAAIRDPRGRGELFYPTTRLICLENSHANSGGRCLSVEYTDKVGELVKRHGLKLHIDGARIFNASVALGVPVDRLVQAADSVSVCLSKGLGAPVGSIIVGSSSFITKAASKNPRWRNETGRHPLCCALVAMKENVAKLESDHKKAKILAEELNLIKGLRLDARSVETNIIFIDIEESSRITAGKLCKDLEQLGILVMQGSSSRVRIVTHHQISESDVQYAVSCFQQALKGVQNENDNQSEEFESTALYI